MIRIKYVGVQAPLVDAVAKTGILWEDGAVHAVSTRQARALLRHPDQWQLVDKKDAATLAKQPTINFINPEGKRVQIPETVLSTPLERLSADEVRAVALHRYGKTFRSDAARARMIDEIEDLAAGMDPITRV